MRLKLTNFNYVISLFFLTVMDTITSLSFSVISLLMSALLVVTAAVVFCVGIIGLPIISILYYTPVGTKPVEFYKWLTAEFGGMPVFLASKAFENMFQVKVRVRDDEVEEDEE